MSETLAELRTRRDALLSEMAEVARRLAEAEDLASQGERLRHADEWAGPDTTHAHLASYARDLLRTLQEAQAERTKAMREAQQVTLRLQRAAARRRALQGVLSRLGGAAGPEASR